MRPKSDILQRLAFAFGGYAFIVVLLTDSTIARLILIGLGLVPLALSASVYRQLSRQLPYRFACTWPCVMPLDAKAGTAANDNAKRRSLNTAKN